MSMFEKISLTKIRQRPGWKWGGIDPEVIPLWLAEPDYPVPLEVKEAIVEAMGREDFGYGERGGSSELRKLMAEKLRKANKIEATSEDIYVTQGVNPSMWLACKYACSPGDEVVVNDPMYFPFFKAADVTLAKKKYWKLDMEDGYKFDADRLNEIITPRTRLIMVCNPHNPTGRVMTEDELRATGEIAVDKRLMVLSDELHEDILFDGRKHVSIASISPEIADRTVSVFGFSKTYNVAGLQIGYIVCTNREALAGMKKAAEGALRGTSTLSQAAAKAMLTKTGKYVDELLRYLHRIRDLAMRRLSSIGRVRCPPLEGTYLIFPHIARCGLDSTQMTEYLYNRAKLMVSDGIEFGPSGREHIRMCISTTEELLNEVMDRFESAISKLP